MLKFKSYDELFENEALKKKSAKSGVSYGTLKKVFNRGMAAWKSGHRPGTTPQQWGHARVNSYITKGKGTYYGADSDLSGKGKKKDKKEGYVSYSQQKAAHASMADKKKKSESVEEDNKIIGNMAKSKKYKGNTSALIRDVKKKYPDQHRSKTVQDIYRKHAETNEANVNEISKGKARKYIGYAARDVFHLGKRDQAATDIGRLGGKHPDQDYEKGPERKASMRVRGIDRATNRLMKKEAMSDAEKAAHQKAIDAFKAKGGKVKKLKPGYAQGYHGKPDPAAGMKGMMDKGDTKFMPRKKVRSMK